MISGAESGDLASAGGIEPELRQVAPGRLDAYERLLSAIQAGQLWMLLWRGQPGEPHAQYGNMEVGGHGYAPAVTSSRELAASGWSRAHEVVSGLDIAASLFRSRFGLWLNPHTRGGGVGVPWADLRRIAFGLDRLPAGPLRITAPVASAPAFYEQLTQAARDTPVIRSLRHAWVAPALAQPYLAVGVELHENSQQAGEAVRRLMALCVGSAPPGVAVASVSLADAYDPVALWMGRYGAQVYQQNASPGYGR